MIKTMLIFTFLVLIITSTFSQTEITLEDYFRDLRSIKVEIAGKTYDFLFDTGGGLTLVSPQIAEENNKTAYGNFVGYRMSGEKFESKLCDSLDIKIGGIAFYHPYVGVFDIMSLLPREFKQVDGLISLKTFENEIISLDLKENKLIIETEISYNNKIRDMDLVKSRFANGTSGRELNIFAGIQYEDLYWWFLFDTGNIAGTKISKNIAREVGIDSEIEEVSSEIAEFIFIIAGDSISTPVIIDNIIHDGVLSYDIIERAAYTISLKEEKVWKNRAVIERE